MHIIQRLINHVIAKGLCIIIMILLLMIQMETSYLERLDLKKNIICFLNHRLLLYVPYKMEQVYM